MFSFFKMKSSDDGRDEFSGVALKILRDSAFRMRVGSSFHQPGTVKEYVLESDICDGSTRRRSLADLRLLEGM